MGQHKPKRKHRMSRQTATLTLAGQYATSTEYAPQHIRKRERRKLRTPAASRRFASYSIQPPPSTRSSVVADDRLPGSDAEERFVRR